MQSPDPLRPGERLFALLLVLCAGFAFRESHAISGFGGLTTGGVMPMLASGVMIVTALVVFADTVRRPRSPEGGLRGLVAYVFPLRVVLFALLVGLYALAIPRLGFLAASGGLLFVSIWWFWNRGFFVSLAVTLLSVGVIHVLFRMVFQVILPGGSVW